MKDIFVAQGHVMDNIELTQPDLTYEEPLVLMRNTGGAFEGLSRIAAEQRSQVRRSAPRVCGRRPRQRRLPGHRSELPGPAAVPCCVTGATTATGSPWI